MKRDLEIAGLAIDSAKERIESARKLIEINNFSDAISRAYYGVLDAARAALILEKEMPKTHAGTISKFNQKFIKTSKVNKKYGPLLNKLERARAEADYQFGVEFTKEEAESILKDASNFVEMVIKLIEEN